MFKIPLSVAVLISVGIGQSALAADQSFVDPTVATVNVNNISIGPEVYVGPYATLRAGDDKKNTITIRRACDIQDNVVVDAHDGTVFLGQLVILAHGATVRGPVSVGSVSNGNGAKPTFVGFNALVEGNVSQDAMVLHLARVRAGVTIPSGRIVLPGKDITTNAEATSPTKTALVTAAEREFMDGVIHVNTEFAHTYNELAAEDASNVYGINYDPGHADFNPNRDLPTLGGVPTRLPKFPARIIGAVCLSQTPEELTPVIGFGCSIRADEGDPFELGAVHEMADRVTVHALEHTHVKLGDQSTFGYHSLVHGGPSPYGAAVCGTAQAKDVTVSGDHTSIGAWVVYFRSRCGSNVTIGSKSLVQQCDLPNGTVVPDRTIMIGVGDPNVPDMVYPLDPGAAP